MSDSPSSQPSNAYLEELMSGYVLNTLSPEETAEFEQYLYSHPELTEQMQQMQEVMGWLAHASKMQAPSQLRSKILAIPETDPETAAQPISSRVISQSRWQGAWQQSGWQGSRWSWQKVGTAMAALLLLGLGVDNLLLRQRLTLLQAEMVEAEDHQDFFTFELRGTSAANLASAKVVIDAHAGEVMVGAKNLPPLPEGEAYHLWAFTDEQNKVLCGRFNTDQAGQFVDRLSVDPAIYENPIQFMRISREPAVTPPDTSRRKLMLTSES